MLDLRLLGKPELHTDDGVVELPLERISWLLCILAARGDWVRREEIAELLWTDVEDTQPRLRQLLYRANKLTDGIESRIGRLRWTGSSDLAQFAQDRQAGREPEALGLVRGELLAGVAPDDSEFGAWLRLERDDLLHQQHEMALLAIAKHPPQTVFELLEKLPTSGEAVLLEGLRLAALLGETTRGLALLGRYEKELSSFGETLPDSLLAAGQALVQHKTQATISLPNLPSPRTPLVGREHELEALAGLLNEHAIVTVVGIGGIGKTSLALEAARRQPFPAVFVSLVGVQAGTSLAPSILLALGLPVQHDPDAELLAALKRRQTPLLLVLDNLEQCIEAARDLVTALFGVAMVRLLLTSRTRLALRGEQVLPLNGLAVSPEPDGFEASGAGAMFLSAARRHGWQPSQPERPVVWRLCRLLAGAPLALELAAAWLPAMNIADIEQEILAGLDFLEGSLPDLPERQAGLRATFLYSWGLLSPSEQRSLRCLSVFRGGFTKDAALEVAKISHREVLSLAEKSLLRFEHGRLSLHELIREYAAEQLRLVETDWAEVGQRHAQHYLALILRAKPHLLRLEQVQWLSVLDLELDNFRTALTWALSGNDAALALELSQALSNFFHTKGLLHEGAQWLLASLDAQRTSNLNAQPTPSPLLAEAWMSLAQFQLMYGDLHLSIQTVQQAVAVAKDLSDPDLQARTYTIWTRALNRLGQFETMHQLCLEALELAQSPATRTIVLAWLGQAELMLEQNLKSAQAHLSQALQVMRLGGSVNGIALIQQALGTIAAKQQDFATARACIQEALTLTQHIKNRFGETLHTISLGRVELQAGNLVAAQVCFVQSLSLAHSVGANRDIAYSHIQLGHIAQRNGDPNAAWQQYQNALLLARELADQRLQLEVVAGMANLYLGLGNRPQAAQYLGLALGHPETNREVAWLLRDTQTALAPLESAKRRGLERGLDQTVSLLLASSLHLEAMPSH
jgi:predicted ATPase